MREKATGHWKGDRKQTTLWQIPARDDQGHGHSTQKPVECMRRPILNNSSPGPAVYEPFSGSGTTVIAAGMSGRVCHAMELSPAYVDVAIQRWQAFTGEEARFEQAGEEETLIFAAVAAARGIPLAANASFERSGVPFSNVLAFACDPATLARSPSDNL